MMKKIRILGRYVLRASFEARYLMKNRIVKVKKRKIPSDLTIVDNDAKMNDIIISLFRYLKKSTKDDTPNKMNNGSVIPKSEFRMILGSNANSAAPTNDIFSSKNFLHKK